MRRDFLGWTPYFPLLGGVVTEVGGLLSHGAVVAREYGLPAIVGVAGVTEFVKSGDVVALDGNKGILHKAPTLKESGEIGTPQVRKADEFTRSKEEFDDDRSPTLLQSTPEAAPIREKVAHSDDTAPLIQCSRWSLVSPIVNGSAY